MTPDAGESISRILDSGSRVPRTLIVWSNLAVEAQIIKEVNSAEDSHIKLEDQCVPCSTKEELPSHSLKLRGFDEGIFLLVKISLLLRIESKISTLEIKKLLVRALLDQMARIHH